MLKPQDVVVVIKVHNLRDLDWTYNELANSLHISPSEVHAALKRCETSGLYDWSSRKVKKHCLLEFLIHGLKYVFPEKPGALTRGIPTAHSAEPLKNLLQGNSADIYVWSDPQGTVRGQSITPLYRSVPAAIKNDPELYELLSLIDAIRVGRVREQNLASIELEKRLTIS
ncbi:hypothetical protein FJR11_20740 [Anabaena sp. UHCC 0187]|uniref:hypothetical protein n=1 Tax=Anabaena sp. UHCC 0187 TaxID=2590018 RepID=UPI0014451B68|nr:hypothetical protein [Anabaena sp. UHCC 0187]MTJ14960.1 hypothetical protein [Anabaena sp. UHCC 0187]